jgi:hypothetical protein
MLDFFLARVRKEPHLGSSLTFESDCDAPVKPRGSTEPPGPFVTIPAFRIPSSPCNTYFALLSSALWTLCKSAGWLRFRDYEQQDAGQLAPCAPTQISP